MARLVAAGLSNKEVAAELFSAVSAVEATLTHVYRKLGVISGHSSPVHTRAARAAPERVKEPGSRQQHVEVSRFRAPITGRSLGV